MQPIEGDEYLDVITGKVFRFYRGEWLTLENIEIISELNNLIFFLNKRISHYEILEIAQYLSPCFSQRTWPYAAQLQFNINYLFSHIKKV